MGFGVEVWGLGIGDWGLGFGVQCSEFEVQGSRRGLGCGVGGLGFRVSELGFRVKVEELRVYWLLVLVHKPDDHLCHQLPTFDLAQGLRFRVRGFGFISHNVLLINFRKSLTKNRQLIDYYY